MTYEMAKDWIRRGLAVEILTERSSHYLVIESIGAPTEPTKPGEPPARNRHTVKRSTK